MPLLSAGATRGSAPLRGASPDLHSPPGRDRIFRRSSSSRNRTSGPPMCVSLPRSRERAPFRRQDHERVRASGRSAVPAPFSDHGGGRVLVRGNALRSLPWSSSRERGHQRAGRRTSSSMRPSPRSTSLRRIPSGTQDNVERKRLREPGAARSNNHSLAGAASGTRPLHETRTRRPRPCSISSWRRWPAVRSSWPARCNGSTSSITRFT